MFDIYIKEYDLDILNAFNEYKNAIDYNNIRPYTEASENALSNLISNIINSIKSLFQKAIDFIQKKLASGAIKKQIRQMEEMLGNTPSVKNKKIEIPFIEGGIGQKDDKISIRKKIQNRLSKKSSNSNDSKTMVVTVGEAFEYVKKNIKDPKADMIAVMNILVSEVQGVNNSEVAAYTSDVAKEYATKKPSIIFRLIRALFDKISMVKEIPGLIKGLFIKHIRISAADKDAIQIIRNGNVIRSITVNGKQVNLINIDTDGGNISSDIRRSVGGTNVKFVACYTVNDSYDGIAIENSFMEFPIEEQNAILYHELAHATRQTFVSKSNTIKTSRIHNKNSAASRAKYINDLKDAYASQVKKYGREKLSAHFDIGEAEADFIGCVNGKYKSMKKTLEHLMTTVRGESAIAECKARIGIINMMHSKGYF